MAAGFKYWILFILLQIHICSSQTASCKMTVAAVKDTVLLLSDDLKSIKNANNKCSLLGGNLAMTDDPQVNTTLTQLMTDKYTTGFQRVYIFYDSVHSNRSRFSYKPAEVDYWKSSKDLGHLWYLDLFRSRGNLKTPLKMFFCIAPDSARLKWSVRAGRNCEVNSPKWNGWRFQFSLLARRKWKVGFQPIFMFSNSIHSTMLRTVNMTYGSFDQYKKTFYAPSVNVMIGARFKKSLNGWYWSDGSPANFPVSNVTTCQQGALHYGIGWEQSSMNCSGEPAYYACQVKFKARVETFPCNASTVLVSWTGLDQFIINNNLTARVEIQIPELKWGTILPYADRSTVIESLSRATNYNINITAILTGCQTLYVTSALVVATPGNSPSTCYPPAVLAAETFECDSSTAVVSWTGLDQFINDSKLNSQVEIHILEAGNKVLSSYSSYSATIRNLNDSTRYSVQVTVIITGSINTNITSNLTVTTPGNPPPSCFPSGSSGGTVAGLLVGILLLIFILAFLVLHRKRRAHSATELSGSLHVSNGRSQQQTAEGNDDVYENVTFDEESGRHYYVTNKLFDMYRKYSESGFSLFSKEFELMVNESERIQHSREVSRLPQNATKNRYKNIFPYDDARVVLQGSGGNDYINAAYIPGYDNERKFIATQGPKKETINDFWLMVWQENSNIIVMLTGLMENGKSKCEQYWPEVGSQTKLSSNLQVQAQQETTIGGIVQRKFVLSVADEQRTITQLQFTTWPDHGIPVTTSNMIHLRNMVDDLQNTNAPIIVHCSAGVGRTGTYIAMDTLFHELDDKGTVDVPRTVLRMRENRTDMIQNSKQYMYVYKLLMERESLMETDKDVTELQSMASSEINRIQENEFSLLSSWRFGEDWTGNSSEVTTYRNNSIGIWDDGAQAVMRIDASCIQEHGSSEFFIAAKNPTPGEEENFWKMVATRSLSLIIDLDGSIKVSVNEALQYGDVSVSVLDVNEGELQTETTLTISSKSFSEQNSTLLQVKGWSDVERPPKRMDFIKIIEEMQRQKSKQNCKCVLVGCSNGSTRTGTFIALVNILERLKAQKRVDVFRTVKDLRDMRPNMVDNKELYKYCYSAVLEYSSDFNTYANLL